MQPSTPTKNPSRRFCFCARSSLSRCSTLFSAFSRIAHVFTSTTSDSPGSAAGAMPCASRMLRTISESASFIWQP